MSALAERRTLSGLVVISAILALLLLPWAGDGRHDPSLHSATGYDTPLVYHVDDDAHRGHSQSASSKAAAEHHHPDHTHEKAHIVQADGIVPRHSVRAEVAAHLTGRTSSIFFPIDRPPRSLRKV